MRCKHCGSVCEDVLNDELTAEEAGLLCDELIEMKLDFITLSGGEPTIRKDWYRIANRLSSGGISTSIITNGWLMDDNLINQAKLADIHTICISIDGTEKTHDLIRRSGSFKKDIEALKKIKENGINTAVITTVSSANIDELEELYGEFNRIGIDIWQLQLAMPMGNFKHQQKFMIEPVYIDRIIDFAYEKIGKGIKVTLADCIGYYNVKAIEVLQNHIQDDWCWQGCSAGKNSIGILHNGDITACTSMRSEKFVVGNIRNQSLKSIWENEHNFEWNRNMTKNQLSGLCKKCQYGNWCLGGCSNSRLCLNDSVFSENRYCSFNYEISQISNEINDSLNIDELEESAISLMNEEQYQVAELTISRLHELRPDDLKFLEWLGYVHYNLENFDLCYELNQKLSLKDPGCFNAHKGTGLSLCKMGRVDEGIEILYSILGDKNDDNAEHFYDLYSILIENHRMEEAETILRRAEKCGNFYDWSEKFNENFIAE
jgi:radical SAM protein with 4Fe4S-binding SPASM domain